jgi:hypothetical protein
MGEEMKARCDKAEEAVLKVFERENGANPYKSYIRERLAKDFRLELGEYLNNQTQPKQPDNSEALKLLDITMRGVALSALCNAGMINQEPLLDQLSEIKDLLEGGEGE